MTPRIDIQPDQPLPSREQMLADAARVAMTEDLIRLRTHAYDCDYMIGLRTGACTCGDAA